VQQLRSRSDAILTGIGTVLADDCRLTDRTGRERSRPLLRIVLDSQLRLPVTARMVTGNQSDLLVVTTSAASPVRYRALENLGVRILTMDGAGGRTDMRRLLQSLAREKYLSLMIEAGSKVNWAALESEVVDKIFFYYAPKILGGLHSLPVVGGIGRRRRSDAITFRNVRLHNISEDEFAVEAWLKKGV
jgi:diaminohydroxyphosphoribosylaminopyrimidine deaminase/5-amino-6-(5-phosphoribosylamino)uracil reductase